MQRRRKSGAHLFNNLEVSAFVSIRSWCLILRAAAAGMMTVTSVDLLGATMRTCLLTIRNVKIVSSLAFCLAMLPASSHAFTQEDQQRLCTGDVFRLCSSEIPDRARIIACMHRQKASLSHGCRSVFGKPTDQAASARRTVYD
jgi:hypothetical protein